jgi:hypothetical protein
MNSITTFNRDGKYDGYVGNGLYSLIPTLLELPDIKCGEIEEKFRKLIEDLLTDIHNINDPTKKMLYDDNVHLKNAREVIQAMFACFNCIIQKIKDENITGDCIEVPETNPEGTIVNISKSLNILQQTFGLLGPEPIDNETSVSESQTISTDSPRSSSNSTEISSLTNPSFSPRSSSNSTNISSLTRSR